MYECSIFEVCVYVSMCMYMYDFKKECVSDRVSISIYMLR